MGLGFLKNKLSSICMHIQLYKPKRQEHGPACRQHCLGDESIPTLLSSVLAYFSPSAVWSWAVYLSQDPPGVSLLSSCGLWG